MASAAANQDPIPTRSIREQDELLEAIVPGACGARCAVAC